MCLGHITRLFKFITVIKIGRENFYNENGSKWSETVPNNAFTFKYTAAEIIISEYVQNKI